jgi:dihydrofolate reductase
VPSEVLLNSDSLRHRTNEFSLSWRNSILLSGDLAGSIARLKQESLKDILALGSRELVASLMQHELIDEYILLIHPLVLGSGRRLFPDPGLYAALQLVEAVTTNSGVVIARYRH